ncbi:cell wall metabolism sensor histidine kinase WalK [Atopobium sp. oral taxon 199]|uniref:sensor histidine kinase n=1 Tax=Atopobium sp. oral taxon 199 TaxID=712156 RepID=UPI00034E34E7|nr:HAMP domain-containing sensor histidine kinase [Atopobium sp. oral taxon 199]EPD77371.1 hypothetical protein HMPREF1527_01303 [Atopobium sp. oral taxon 199 str. F0494]
MSSEKRKRIGKWAKNLVKTRSTSRSESSTARSISWGFWWRKLLNYLFFNLLLFACVALILVYSYNKSLPQDTFTFGFFPARYHAISLTFPNTLSSFSTVRYIVHGPDSSVTAFELGKDLIALWPLYAAVLIWELLDLLHYFNDTRRVKRALLPLNTLALKAEKLGNADLLASVHPNASTDGASLSHGKMESLEQAIERASVDSPQIHTGNEDLASIEIALNKLLHQMQEAKLQQMRFVNDASHELRTPIAVIRGYTDMLDRWGKTDEAVLDESIAALKSESEHMHDLVEQLLFLARGDAGRNTLTRVPLNFAQLAFEVWEESDMIDASHHYVLGFDKSALADNRYQTVGDIAMLKQSLRIIVQNAARYSPAKTPITFNISYDEKNVQVSIEDEGMGISEAAVAHIFERFWRADNARAKSNDGSGLGLSIAKWIVDSHDGSIDVLSREGVGTRFSIAIPRVALR